MLHARVRSISPQFRGNERVRSRGRHLPSARRLEKSTNAPEVDASDPTHPPQPQPTRANGASLVQHRAQQRAGHDLWQPERAAGARRHHTRRTRSRRGYVVALFFCVILFSRASSRTPVGTRGSHREHRIRLPPQPIKKPGNDTSTERLPRDIPITHPTPRSPPPSFAVSVPASLFRLNSSPSKTKKIHRSRRPRFVLALRDGNGPTASSRRASRNFPRIPQTDETQKLQVRRRVCESRGGGFRRTAVPVRLRKLASRRGADEGEAAGRCGELFEPRLKF